MKKIGKIIGRHVFLAILAFIWLIPVFWLVVTTFSTQKGINTNHFFPAHWTLANYHQLFFEPDSTANFPAWFKNSMIIGVFSCLVSSIFVIMTAYAFSFIEFKGRKKLMSFSLILGMFPGVLSMIAMYFILKMLGLTDSVVGLIILYSGASGLGYLILKGFFDTIPVSLHEAAKLEGASEATIFAKIVVPLSKPMIVYTVINSFLNPWMDFVMVRLMIKSKDASDWTMALGLFNLLQRALVNQYFTYFCCGGLMIAVPISILFIIMQKFYVEGVTGGAVKG
ncbi:sugar ABC transporter permease [Pseudobutyrivibrio ruminis]|uniref:Arabinogalactan oligomer / maltooligosaccharide transport system permease protein n=1 Tax=Pseudobutyrivibrio ruminis DSM 9787 TaxID=1123011 RepID=A0A285S8W5_9FIRM|nr:ABC transporter permease subunit [Pseudobutyrivibrio ruminis]SOC03811.1 arabinogalactan oligomer / maltooligosaccharide transport system permease protein [Pseudobutyrivibrio ruminis DSM 9787]